MYNSNRDIDLPFKYVLNCQYDFTQVNNNNITPTALPRVGKS